MEARISVHDDVAIIHLSGRVDFDSHDLFRAACLRKVPSMKFVFDMTHLSFVGSNAITPLVNTLEEISKKADGMRMYGVSSEFRKIFKASEIKALSIFEERGLAMQSFHFIEDQHNVQHQPDSSPVVQTPVGLTVED